MKLLKRGSGFVAISANVSQIKAVIMNKYREIREKYLTDEITDVEALEQLLLLSDVRSSRFWELLKMRRNWCMNYEISKELDNHLNDYF
jgi:hypothetical protein